MEISFPLFLLQYEPTKLFLEHAKFHVLNRELCISTNYGLISLCWVTVEFLFCFFFLRKSESKDPVHFDSQSSAIESWCSIHIFVVLVPIFNGIFKVGKPKIPKAT